MRGDYQAAYTTVTETLTCWLPGEIGTAPLAALACAPYMIGVDWSAEEMLMTWPSGTPSAWANWAALAWASFTAFARAEAGSAPSSVRLSETLSTGPALP